MISRIITKTVDLSAVQKVDQLEGPLYQLEEAGHTFQITCLMDGSAASVSGTVSARFVRADETTVYFTGSLSGNVATITLPQSCYNINGRFGMVVFISGSDVTSAIYAVAGNVYRSTSDTVIDPTGEIPSLEELMAIIGECETATTNANTAAANANNSVSYASAQSKTDAEKAQARSNIDSPSTADLSQLSDEIAYLEETAGDALKIVETSESDADLYVSDAQGNVIAKFSGGHIQTQNFDSSDAITQTDLTPVSAAATDAQETASQLQTGFDYVIGEYSVTVSPNLYDPSLQTPETISPHYYVNGAPYSTTQFDASYNCTALIPVEPNTQYTVGLIGNAGGIVNPWNAASHRGWSYDANGNYISGSGWTANTFTTPSNAAYIRFNYYIDSVPLSVLNAQCMLVKGSSLPSTYQAYGTTVTSELQDKIDAIDIGCEYKFSGTDLLISYGYNDTYDAVVMMNAGRANGLFDFAALKLKPKGDSLNDYETADLIDGWSSGSDMHGPFQFLATSNADGYYSTATSPGFVGGNHTLDQLGSDFKTASSKYIHYFADGKPVSSGYGKCSHFEIRWANDVQAYNTVKQGGGGRSCLTEYHDMIFDGVRFNEEVKLVPSEEIIMSLWYGFQLVSFGTAYTKVRFIDGANRGIYTASGAASGNAMTSGIEAWGTTHAMEMLVDTTCDLGKRTYYTGSSGAFTSGSKGYFTIINGQNVTMSANEAYYLRGSYRFYPVVE